MTKVGRTGRTALVAAAMATALAGCSTKPRNFAASVSTPVADRVAFERDYRTCDSLVRSGHQSDFRAAGRGVAVSMGAAGAGVGTAAAVGSTAGTASGWGGIGAGMGAAAAAATLAVGVVGFGLTRLIRGGREQRYKKRMAACLNEHGYQVADWEKLKKREDAAVFASQQVTVAEPTRAEPVLIEAVVTSDGAAEPAAPPPAPIAMVTPEG